ncbi:MAG TPA: NADH-quinone oxidoreductase subunit J [Limnochordia bacterium]|nr:NADH-quinone oxidoreductase subunit J [Limnochordia bacterium]
MSNGAGLLFVVASALVLIAAYFTVSARKLMHAALWLGAAFFGVSADYLLLDADFLAAAQVLIYIGAIATMIIFGIMLSDPSQLNRTSGEPFWRRTMRALRSWTALVAVAGFVVLEAVLQLRAAWPQTPAAAGDTVLRLGQALFTRYVLPFEVASAVLLVALIGAIVLSMEPEGAGHGATAKEELP